MNSGFVQVELDPVMGEKVQGVSIAANPMSSENIPNILKKKKKTSIPTINIFLYKIKNSKFYSVVLQSVMALRILTVSFSS